MKMFINFLCNNLLVMQVYGILTNANFMSELSSSCDRHVNLGPLFFVNKNIKGMKLNSSKLDLHFICAFII